MRRSEALRAYCANPANIGDVTLRGAKLAVHQTSRASENATTETPQQSMRPTTLANNCCQQDEASEVATCISKVIQRSRDPSLTHAPRMALVKWPRRSKKHGRIAHCAIPPGHRGSSVAPHCRRQGPRSSVSRPRRAPDSRTEPASFELSSHHDFPEARAHVRPPQGRRALPAALLEEDPPRSVEPAL